jgi:SNF2 family DNA or RNA helicase
LAYELRKRHLPLQADEKVSELLQSALSHENDYRRASTISAPRATELVGRLAGRGFVRSLTEHQLRNVLRLVSLPSGATFSVPGAGKTTEALAYFYYKRQDDSRLLVVCPKNAFAVWEEQTLLCLSTPPGVVRLRGGEDLIKKALRSDATIFLVTYQQLPNIRNLIAAFLVDHPTFVFLDESHHIKRGAGGQWCSTVLSLAHLPVSKLIMTGTPLPNSESDLVPQLNFLFPELDVAPDNATLLVKPVFVRTTKRELGLPEVKVLATIIQLRPQQRHLYELLRSEQARQLGTLSRRDKGFYRTVGKSVMRLLEAVSNPALLVRNEAEVPDDLYAALEEGDSPKLEYACYRARKLAQAGQKVIIWSTFVDNVELISSRLSDIGADFIHGGVEAGSEEEENTREHKIGRFHRDDRAMVLVANPAACAEAISLHMVCHYAIYLDRNYNAGQYLQSVDRIHRLGLARDVVTTVEILLAPDTVDDSVMRRLNLKIRKMEEVLQDRSISVEPVEQDLEADGIDADDIRDFLNHLKRV